jgi:hypothetical protein
LTGRTTGQEQANRRPEDTVQIDKDQILELLRSQGQHDQAQQADDQLPQTVDTEEHGGILQSLGLSPQELITKLAGGGLGGGLGGLGGLLGR